MDHQQVLVDQVGGQQRADQLAAAHDREHTIGLRPQARDGGGDIARAVETDETAGQMKVLVDPKTERVLGAALVGAEAGELIHVFVALMQAGASARAIVDAEFVHPTFSEGVQSLVMKLERFSLR